MDDLPELPFEKVLSYLSLQDLLCYSNRPGDYIHGIIPWVSGAFAENFISSTRFATFFDTFGQTIFSSLKRLRLCDIDLNEEDPTEFIRILNSFGRLEQLDIIRVNCSPPQELTLNLPTVTRLQLAEVLVRTKKLTLEAPKLREIKLDNCFSYPSMNEISSESGNRWLRSNLRLEIVHGESVERLLVDRWEYTEVSKLKNLKALYNGKSSIEGIDSTLLSSLQQLKEIHTNQHKEVSKLFEQKQLSGRADLKIYLWGLLLNGPDDPAINVTRFPEYLSRELLVCLAENSSRLADEIHFYRYLRFSNIEGVAPGLEVDLLKRFTDLNAIMVTSPVQNIDRFLDLLKNCDNIVELDFGSAQPQDLFDRLPEHSAAQDLTLSRPPSDLAFLFRLKHLIKLDVKWSIDRKTVQRAFQELPVLCLFRFGKASIEIRPSNEFKVSVGIGKKTVSNLNAAIELIFGKEKPSKAKKRKAKVLE